MATSPVPIFTLSNGQSMPGVGLGTWQSTKGDCLEAVKVAIECGYRHIDTAAIYDNEAEVGEGIKIKVQEGTITRDDVFITTKLFGDHARPDLVEVALKDSLQKLGVDYVNLYLIHTPFAFRATDEGGWLDSDGKWQLSDVDFVDTWRAMEQLVDKGLTRSIGVCNFNSEQLARLLSMKGIKHKPVLNQVEIHPYLNNNKLIAYCKGEGVAVTAYSPLGALNHPQKKPVHPSLFDEPILNEIGQKYGKTAAQVALRWGVQRDTIVIPKSVTPSRIRENIQIFDFELSQADMDAVSALHRHFRACDFDTATGHKYYPFNIAF